ncbi:MAG: class I SAM-dependent methyltransferase [Myxococcales bacterium]|nr:class I SAM-dependent methyltransferase [Myxococcales bacterium]
MATFHELDWYETPRWYDAIYDVDTEHEADFLVDALECYGPASRRRRAIEPACGTGRLLAALGRRGFQVAGFDQSEAMLAFARERLAAAGVAARVTRGELEAPRIRGRYELAFCLVSTFKYVLDEAGARRHLAAIADALVPGGIYLLGLHLCDYAETRRRRERWVARCGDATVVCNVQTWPPDRARRRERVRSRLHVTRGDDVQRTETTWEFRTYDARQLAALVRAVPTLEHVATHDFTYSLDSTSDLTDGLYDVLLVLRRR